MGNGNESAVKALTDKMAPTPGEALIAGGATVQQIRTRTVTAVRCQVERDLQTVAKRVVTECQFDPEGLFYSWSVANKGEGRSKVEGPSIKMAMILARNWSNSETDAELIAETATHWILRGLFYDYELGSTTARLYRQRKPKEGKGKMDRDRQEDIDFQIGQSKAIRNAVLNAMPAGLVTKAMNAAKSNIRDETARDMKTKGGQTKTINRIKRAFGKWNVTLEMLETKLEKTVKDWTADEVTELSALWQALDDGQTSIENEFDQPDKKADFGAALGDEDPPPPDDDDVL